MNILSTHTKNIFLENIVNRLILNTSFINNLGLYHGKMGIVLFFAHYAQYTHNPIYEKFAWELMEEIYEDIPVDSPLNLENGLCGIGWGILYLLQNNLMEGEADEILSELDKKIMEWDVTRINDHSIQTGLSGIYIYIQERLKYNRLISNTFPFDERYLNTWKKIYNSSLHENFINIDTIID